MKLEHKLLRINPKTTRDKLVNFIKQCVNDARAAGIALGVSGGVDSAVTAALAASAVGGNRVLGVYMPEDEVYSSTDHDLVKLLAESFQFQLITTDLTQALNSMYRTIPHYYASSKIARGNVKARTRMLILYYYANTRNLLVAGSSDKSETMIGYFTKWGDAASDISPIINLYKTEVRQLGRYLHIPLEIIDKPSTPALWPGQTAEEEIGLKYELLDLILYGLSHSMSDKAIASDLELPVKSVANIRRRCVETEHKRQMSLRPDDTKLDEWS